MAPHRAAVFYIMAGHGHVVPAQAIADGLRRCGYDAQAIDFFRLMRTPIWARVLRRAWRLYLRFPELERRSQRRLERRSLERLVLDRIRVFYRRRFVAWFRVTRPSVIVTSNFVPAWIVSGYVADMELPTRLFAYNSDVFSAHALYVCPRVPHYLSPEPGATMLIAKGQPAASVSVCPVPLRSEFTHATETRTTARSRLGLADRFTLLLSLGGEGIGSLAILEELGRRAAAMQVVLIGRGAEQRAGTVRSAVLRYPSLNIVDAGFVRDPSPYVIAADIVAGKAGANTVCEALALHRPFLITTAYFNVETTASYLERYGAGWFAADPAAQAQIVMRRSTSGGAPDPGGSFDALPMEFGAVAFAKLISCLTGS